MSDNYHVLNGDALREQFPENIPGDIIVLRECLVDGPVRAKTLEDFFALRAAFISAHYNEVATPEYFANTVSEINKLLAIPAGAKVYLWFEDDLFCQVNFWFVMYWLQQKENPPMVYLVRPQVHTAYGFAGLEEEELIQIFQNSVLLTKADEIATLWTAYQQGDTTALLQTARDLPTYPFIREAVEAHLDRIPDGTDPGRPVRALRQIMLELGTQEFSPVFKVFSQREAIYGFGDLQVKRLWKILVEDGITD